MKVDLRKSVVLSERTFIAHCNGVRTGNGFTFGPVLVTIRVVVVDGCAATADGWHAASYYVSIDGAHQFGGRMNGLNDDGLPKGASFLVFGAEITSTPTTPDSTPVDSTPTSVTTTSVRYHARWTDGDGMTITGETCETPADAMADASRRGATFPITINRVNVSTTYAR